MRVVRPSSQNVSHFPLAQSAQGYNPPLKNPRPIAGGFVQMQAFAKINLFLDVVGKREDGYHNIVSVMQSVDLCDDLLISAIPEGIQLSCDNPALPTDEKNLIVKAAKALISEFAIPHGFRIELTKRIPLGAGLAGGSSDCAATLHGINKLCGLNIPFPRLLEIGKSLGADVPFCLTGGTALTEGIGEKITPLQAHPSCFILIVCPKIHVSTGEIFSRLSAYETASPKKILNAISKKNLQQISTSFYNIFTPITSALHTEISDLIFQLKKLGAMNAEMSGTGSSVFAYFNNEKSALNALDIFRNELSAHNALNILKSTKEVFLCKPQNNS